jgi:RNA polymerase sigma-70 factor, ECF subfamily
VDQLLQEWAPRVYRYALRLCGDAHTAEDLTQETMLRAWRNRQKLREQGAGRVWLFRIATNLWHDQLRRRRSAVARAEPLPDSVLGADLSAESIVSGHEDLRRALDALSGLPPRQREALYLSACESMSANEIAQVTGVTREAVKANLSLARKKMREWLGQSVM